MRAMISARRLGPLLPEAKASQPDRDVHFGALNLGLQHIIVRSGQSVQEVPDGWFSVSIGVSVKTVPRSLLTVRISARGNDRKLCQDQRERSAAGITISWVAGAWRLIVTESMPPW